MSIPAAEERFQELLHSRVQAAPPLRELLEDPNESVRKDAAEALRGIETR